MTNSLHPPFTRTRNRRPPYLFFAALLASVVLVVWLFHPVPDHPPHSVYHHGFSGSADFAGPVLNKSFVPCRDARGNLLSELGLQSLGEVTFEDSPKPFAGGYDDLLLKQTWLTAKQRFGPYGLGETEPGYNHTRVDWDHVDWAELQDACAMRNHERFLDNVHLSSPDLVQQRLGNFNTQRRMAPPTVKDWRRLHQFYRKPTRPKRTDGTGRTAIVLRAWSTFHWAEENLWTLRSLITEAALASGGEYAVFLLVDVKNEHSRTYPDFLTNEGYYDYLLDNLVPREFRNITILTNRDLQRMWYPEVGEYRPEFQMFQPLQLFAQSYPEFDYYYQMEMDVRFTGNAGELLRSIAAFARNEPRKQARQRLSYFYLPSVYNTYENFTSQVDAALDGGDAYYEGVRIPDITNPFGPPPPFSDPQDDPFEWGVGEEADFLTFSPCNNITIHPSWVYYEYINKFKLGTSTPRLVCSVTVSRSSWNLLNAVHTAQIEKGFRVQSEATMINFALWNGAKISLPPLPMYSRVDHRFSADVVSLFTNGGLPSSEHDGMAWGEFVYGKDGKQFAQNTPLHGDMDLSWRYKAKYPQELWNTWLNGTTEDYDRDDLPALVLKDGEVYLPNTMFHPVKTNKGPKNNEPPKFLRMFGLEAW